MKKNALWTAALAASLMVAGCGKGPGSEADAPPSDTSAAKDAVELPAEAAKTAELRVETVAERTIRTTLEVPGTVNLPADSHAVVSPPVAGKVLRLYAKVGDAVRRGQPLVQIQSGDLAQATSDVASAETQAAQAAAAVRQQASAIELARGRLRTAQAGLERQRRFAQEGAFSQPSLTVARNEASAAETEDAAAKSELAGAQSRLDRAERLSKEGLVSKADLDQARLDVQQAQIRVERGGQRLRLAEQTLQRESRIGRQGLLNAREIQTAEAEARAAKLELDQAQVALQGAKSALVGAQRAVQNARANAAALRGGGAGGASTVTLSAPITGTVVEREATLGQAVERSSELFDIDDDSTMWVTASVPEADIARVRPGAAVTIATPSRPGRSFAGTVQLLGEKLDPKTRTLSVQCRVPNGEGLLRAGLTARVRLAVGTPASVIAIPSSALVGQGEDLSVFVGEGGKYKRRRIKTGRKEGELIEVASGLRPGERVVVSGAFTLDSEQKSSEGGE